MAKRTYDVECGLLSKLIEEQDYKNINDFNITPELFVGDNKKVFRFIQEHYMSHNEIPSERIILRNFPHYSFEKTKNAEGETIIGTKEALSYWVEETRNKTRHNSIVAMLEDIKELLTGGDSVEALDLMYSRSLAITMATEADQPLITNRDAALSLERYKERSEKGLVGIATGFACLDESIRGWADSTLNIIIAKTGSGKTWMEIICAVHAVLQGKKVLFGTTELPKEQVQDRFHALMTAVLYEGLNYTDYMRGQLTSKQKKLFQDYIENEADAFEPLIIFDAVDVTNVAANIDKYRPDLVLIDGVYLMDDVNRAEQDWLRISNITRDLKKIAKLKKIPIVGNNQADMTTTSKKGPGLENMSYSKAVGTHADIVVSIFQDEQQKEDKEAVINVLKNREGPPVRFAINFDFTCMNFSSLYVISGEEKKNAIIMEEE